MDAEELRRRLRAPVRSPEVPASSERVELPVALAAPIGSDDAADLAAERTLVAAAVLVPLLLGPDAGVLLTKRTAHLSAHAGQVSFPGGRIDPGDADAEAAALREAHEEIALDPSHVEVIGRMGDYVTGTGYVITPVLGLLDAAFADLGVVPSPHEVESVFVLPMAVLLDRAAPSRKRAAFRGRWREFWVWPHPDHYIWGATAAILVNLAAQLRADPPA